jgi:hypothetical protein
MSFLRHERSIVRCNSVQRGRNDVLFRPPLLTVSMSRNRLFLGGLLSSRARLRFTGWSQLLPPSRFCKLSGMCPV